MKVDLVNSAKDIVRACDIISRLTRQLAVECNNKDIHKVLSHLYSITATAVPMTTTKATEVYKVKASSINLFYLSNLFINLFLLIL